MCTKYNGWSNYETWLTNLWLEELIEPNSSAKEIKESIENFIDTYELPNGMIGDIINHFLSDIDYHELAEHHKEVENLHYGNRWDDDLTPEDVYAEVA